MSATVTDNTSEVQSFRRQAWMAQRVVRLNVEGVTHEESLIQPNPGGNCLNWIVGHLVWVYLGGLRVVGQTPPMEQSELSQYARGGPPLEDPSRARNFGELLAAWDDSTKRLDDGLAGFPADMLGQPAPFSPTDNPEETYRSLLSTMFFHQAYHAGQTAVLRRLIGKPGAIK